jgi:hypothetical protein
MVRAKMVCTEITQWVSNKSVKFMPVTSGSEENKSFSKYTPGGELRLTIDPSTDAYNAFEVGKEYYVDITPAQ